MERERVGWFAKANLGRKLGAWQGMMVREQSAGCWLALKSNRRAVWVLAATSDLLNGEPEGDSWDGGGKKGQEFECVHKQRRRHSLLLGPEHWCGYIWLSCFPYIYQAVIYLLSLLG